MNVSDYEVITNCDRWLESGHIIYFLTVMDTWGSSPRPPGSISVIRDDGKLLGSVSGGCVEEALVDRLIQSCTITQFPATVSFGGEDEDASRFMLPCNGVLHVLIEKITRADHFKELLKGINTRRGVIRELDIQSGEVHCYKPDGRHKPVFYQQGAIARRFFGPSWQLALVGNTPVARVVAKFALDIGFAVVMCDPRQEFADRCGIEYTDFSSLMPDDFVMQYSDDPYNAFIALSHDPKIDDMALMEALKSKSFYIGALGSRRSSALRRERLSLLELTDHQIIRLHAPVGLSIKSKTPEEIAISILAEVIKEKNSLTSFCEEK